MSDDLSLADIPAGPELGELLDYVGQHRDELRGAELVEFITATRRQINHLEATCIAAVNEVGVLSAEHPRTRRATHGLPE